MICLYLVVVAVTVAIFIATLRLGGKSSRTPTATTMPDRSRLIRKGRDDFRLKPDAPPDTQSKGDRHE